MGARIGCRPLTVLAASLLAASPALAQSTATYAYDPLGRLVRVTYPSGAFVAYTYDAADNRTLLVMSLAANNLPVANPDGVTPGPIAVAATGATNIDVLANDTDADNDTRTVNSVTPGAKGTVAIVSAGAMVAYTPTAGQTGADSFSYTIVDARGGVSAPATVSVNIVANSPPDAVNDSRSTGFNTAVTFDPRTNDTDPNGDPITVTGVSGVVNGTASFTASSVTFTPTTNFSGTGSFSYAISDGRGGTDTATVTVAVAAAPNSPPDAVNDSRATAHNTPITFDPRANDTDPNGDPITVTGVNSAVGGTASFTAASVTFTPTTGTTGVKTFNYTISDGRGGTDSAAVSINVSPPANSPPDAVNDVRSSAYNTSITFDPRTNDTDPNGDPLTITGVSNNLNGLASTNGSTVSFLPRSGFSGVGSFNYAISDGRGGTDTAQVTINVGAAPPNTPPVAVADTRSTAFRTPITFDPRVNDTDANGDALIVSSVANAVGGTASNTTTSVTFTPNSTFSGAGSFTYSITDGQGGFAGAQVTVNVGAPPPNSPPVAVNDTRTTPRGVTLTFDPRVNDSDPNGDPITITGVTQAQFFIVGFTATSVTAIPNPTFVGTRSFTYTISDGRGGTAVGTVTVTAGP